MSDIKPLKSLKSMKPVQSLVDLKVHILDFYRCNDTITIDDTYGDIKFGNNDDDE